MESTYYNQFVILNVVSCASGFNAFTHLTYIGQALISRLGSGTADCDRIFSAISPFIYPYLVQNLQMHGFYLQCPIAWCLKQGQSS